MQNSRGFPCCNTQLYLYEIDENKEGLERGSFRMCKDIQTTKHRVPAKECQICAAKSFCRYKFCS